MPNAILRAGPFASSSSSFLNQPEPLAIHGLDSTRTVPVNCASEFPFRAYVLHNIWPDPTFAEIQLKESGSELINTSNENQERSHNLYAMFRYQAAIDFNVKLNYVISASATTGTVTCVVNKQIGINPIQEIEKLNLHNFGNSGPIDIDKEVVIPLTASVVPRFVGFHINLTAFSWSTYTNLISDASIILKPD
jgi:hypothetical protein